MRTQSSRRPISWTSAFVILIIGALIAAYAWTRSQGFEKWATESDRRERTETLLSAIAICDDVKRCIGGYVTHRFNNKVLHINDCKTACGKFETDVEWLKQDFKCCVTYQAEEIHSIVLPHNKKWAEVAVRYEQQFVHPSQQRR